MKKLILLPILLLAAAQPLCAMEGSSANNSEITQDPTIPLGGYAPFNTIPTEMIKEIFSHLNADDIYNNTVLACKLFLQVVKQQNGLTCTQPEEKELINKFVQVIRTCGVDKAIQFNIQIQPIYDLLNLCNKIDNHQLTYNVKKELMNFIFTDTKQVAAKQFNAAEIHLIERYQNELGNVSFGDYDLFKAVLDNFNLFCRKEIENIELANFIGRIFIKCAPLFNASLSFGLYDEFINNSQRRYLDSIICMQTSFSKTQTDTNWSWYIKQSQPSTSCSIQ